MEQATQEKDDSKVEQERFKGDENDPSGLHYLEWKRTLLSKAKKLGGAVMIAIFNGELTNIPTPPPRTSEMTDEEHSAA